MNSLERCLAVLAGRDPDRVPVVPQTFMFAVETAGVAMGNLVRDARKMAQAHVVSQERYGYDGCIIDFDDASLAEACGAAVIYRAADPAIVDEAQEALILPPVV